jgi:phenylacetate-CoA ligase
MSALYEAAFRRVLFPAYETGLKRRRTLAHLDDYRRDQWLAPEQIAALQWTRLQHLLQHCYREVPYYRKQWRELGITPQDIRHLDDYARLPILTKADIRAHFDELKADSWRNRLLYKATGGSTGEPMRFGYTRESNDRRTAVMWRGYEWAGSRMGRRTLFLWGGAVGDPTRAHQFKDRLYNAVFARRVLNSFTMTDANMADYADAIDRYRPDIIVAYVGPLVQLARWLIENGRQIWQPQGIIGGAEAMHEFQRYLIQQAFKAPAFNTYGCRGSSGGRGTCTAWRRPERRCRHYRPFQLRHAVHTLRQWRHGDDIQPALRLWPRLAAADTYRRPRTRCDPHAGRTCAARRIFPAHAEGHPRLATLPADTTPPRPTGSFDRTRHRLQ